MSFIVPMEKPKRCGLCPCFHAEHPMYCQAVKADKSKRIYAPYGEGRPDWCPLIELPPHGRLGDLDKLWDRMYNYIDNEGAKMPFGDNDFMIHRDSACELIEDAPTVIEAEGET